MSEFNDKLLRRAHSDLAKRSRGGIVVYLLAWLSITLPVGLHHENPVFFQVNLAILLLLLAIRLGHLYYYQSLPDFSPALAKQWLIWSILAGALHWGLMTAWILLDEDWAKIQYFLLIATAVFCTSGSTALAISNKVRLYYPILMIIPTIGALLLRGGNQDQVLSLMALVALGYVLLTSRTAHQDYWDALTNRELAEKRARELELLNTIDSLTRLKNRSYFDQRYVEDWKLSDRLRVPLSLLILDIDHFKSVNDTYGHVFGDYCLQQVAKVLLSESCRESDTVARYGGEEFVVLLPNTDENGAAIVAERMRDAVENCEISQDGHEIILTISIGGATAHPAAQADSQNLLLKQADEALYGAKANGRNRYEASTPVRLAVADR